MSDDETPPRGEGETGAAGDADASPSPALSTAGLLTGAVQRLAANPAALAALLAAGVVVAGADWVHLHDPIPTREYEGVQRGRVTAAFTLVVTVLSRTSVPASALLHLEPRWLATTVGLSLLAFAVVTLAGGYALARLLDADLTAGVLVRYGLAVAALGYGRGTVTFEGGASLLAVPLLVGLFVVVVRLVPFPGRLVLGEGFRAALGRSWRTTRGHGWALFGVVVVVGLGNHLLASVPVVGPVGSAAAAAVHAGVVAEVCDRLRPAGETTAGVDADHAG